MISVLFAASSQFDALLRLVPGSDENAVILRVAILIALGAMGIYLMLPRGVFSEQREVRWVGALLTTISCVLLACAVVSYNVEGKTATVFQWLGLGTGGLMFYLLALVSLASATMMITSRNPVYSALWFALVLLSNSGLYLTQGAEFLSAATIIVYAGAIIVTFLFVIMLAQPSGTASYDRVSREPALACIAGALLASLLVGTVHFSLTSEPARLSAGLAESVRPPTAPIQAALSQGSSTWRIAPKEARGHVDGLGRTLFLDHYVSIEVIGVLLLAAVVGAMLIASHRLDTSGGSTHGRQ